MCLSPLFFSPPRKAVITVARRPDLPCAGCGRLLWRGAGSLPEGEAKCRDCRREQVKSDVAKPVRSGRTLRAVRDGETPPPAKRARRRAAPKTVADAAGGESTRAACGDGSADRAGSGPPIDDGPRSGRVDSATNGDRQQHCARSTRRLAVTLSGESRRSYILAMSRSTGRLSEGRSPAGPFSG
jgi:hypothetical protein